MKRIYLSALLLTAALALSAQTYSGGVWYALLDNSSHTMNTQGDYETAVFAPTQGTLNVEWKYEWIDLFGAFKKIDTEVLESANGGSSTNKIGSLAENTGKNSQTTESFSSSRNINWIKFNRTGVPTHKVVLKHLDIRLAQHILLASGTFGTTEASYDFGDVEMLSASGAHTVNLRSFLSAGDITITCSEPETFHLGAVDGTDPIVYAVGANACASANGSAAQTSTGVLAKISNYDFKVWFTPKEAKQYAAVITLTDGVSTARLTVTGNGKKMPQTLTWDQADEVLTTGSIVPATASSGLEVSYHISPDGIVSYADGAFTILSAGTVEITATQAGNEQYESVSLTKTITVSLTPTEVLTAPVASPIVLGQTLADAELIGGEASAEGTFAWQNPETQPTEAGEQVFPVVFTPTDAAIYAPQTVDVAVLVSIQKHTQTIHWEDTIPTLYVGQTFPLTASASSNLPVQFLSSDETIASINAENVLVAAAAGEVTISAIQPGDDFNEAADTLEQQVLILPPPTTYSDYEAEFCQGDSVEFHGQWYYASAQADVLVAEKNSLGGDSIVHFTATMHPTYLLEEEFAFPKGMSHTWQTIVLDELPVGDTTLYAHYTTVEGCDSTHVLHLTVQPMITTYGTDTFDLCAGERATYEGKTYRRPTKDSVLVSQRNQFGGDSVVWLVVNVHPVMRMSFSQTITEGEQAEWQNYDLSVLPAGDTTLVAAYTSVYGCDSTFTLRLTVRPKISTGWQDTETDDTKVEKIIYQGQLYIRRGDEWFDIYGRPLKRR